MTWAWAILLLILGLGLAVMEVFFASAGILGFLATASIIGAIVLGFQFSPGFGIGLTLATLVGLPSVIVAAFRYWPRTRLGRRVLLTAPSEQDVLPDEEERRWLRSLVGKRGRAKCKMLPGGLVIVEGRTIEAVSEGQPIEAGEPIVVVQVRGKRLIVRPDNTPDPQAEDPLRRPIETILGEPFLGDDTSADPGTPRGTS